MTLGERRERDAEARAAISAELRHASARSFKPTPGAIAPHIVAIHERCSVPSRGTRSERPSVSSYWHNPNCGKHGICAALYVTESPIVRRPGLRAPNLRGERGGGRAARARKRERERERQRESLIPSRDENDRPRNEISIREDRQSATDRHCRRTLSTRKDGKRERERERERGRGRGRGRMTRPARDR